MTLNGLALVLVFLIGYGFGLLTIGAYFAAYGQDPDDDE